MKLIGFAFLAVCFGVALAKDALVHHNGQPGCKTPDELSIQKYRNNWDPTSYWVCSQQNVPAVEHRCPPSLLFLDEQKECVDYSEWIWTEPKEPPSRP